MKLTELSKLVEGTPRVSGARALEMLQSLSDTIHVKMYIHEVMGKQVEYDPAEVMHDVMQCIAGYKIDSNYEYDRETLKHLVVMEHGLEQLRLKIGSLNNEHKQVDDAAKIALKAGWTPAPWAAEILEANRKVLEKRQKMEGHLHVVDNVLNYIGNLPSLMKPESKLDDHDRALVRAVLKNLGILS